VPYGCEHNRLDAIAFTGAQLAPGPVWLLPRGAPARWRPRPIAIEVAPEPASEAHRVDRVGPLTLELARTDATHATLAIAVGKRVLGSFPIERAAMAGADPGPLDLREPGVAIPMPVAAWSIADAGPILLVLLVRHYDGVRLWPILVEQGGARELPDMARYLYQCAF